MNALRSHLLLATASLILVGAPGSASLASSTPFTVNWTAPGDDGSVGRASVYDLRYSNLPLTAANFSLATRITGLPAH